MSKPLTYNQSIKALSKRLTKSGCCEIALVASTTREQRPIMILVAL